jgi:hypothetical protein
MADWKAEMLGRKSVTARLKAIPADIQRAVADRLKIEVDDMVSAMRRAAPVGGQGDPHTGALRDSIHAEPASDQPLSYRITADVKDDQGRFVSRYIEFGHRAADGTMVPPRPSFYPTYRARKTGMRRRLSAAARKAIKAFTAQS